MKVDAGVRLKRDWGGQADVRSLDDINAMLYVE